ncbi:endonuclease [Actinoplanes sp. LDG1-06]|uniref:Endonuclease n=1 Tax=Paractinoplanes ovalisporus TaxID=2810368 RepID=A0ABS2AC68_9ACTN|nr:endonuclease [Actinoplanes ovalisporus]
MRTTAAALMTTAVLMAPTPAQATATDPLTVGVIQGNTARSPYAPPTGNGSSSAKYQVRGVVTQLARSHTSAGVEQYGFFLQSRKNNTDGDPASSDGVFVYMGTFSTLIGGYTPKPGDEIIMSARVAEYFNLTQLTSAEWVTILATGLDLASEVQIDDAIPPAQRTASDLYWEQREGMQLRVRAGSGVVSNTKTYASTDDAEVWLVDRDDPLMKRPDPYARRVFRDAHPLDDVPGPADNGNGNRIMLGPMGVKAAAGDSSVVLPPARTFDTTSGDAVGGVYFAFNKYGIQVAAVAFTRGADPAANNPPRPANRQREVSIATFNVENLYDFRDDPNDGCDFTGNTGCPGVTPPFDYTPGSQSEYDNRLGRLARQVTTGLHSPDLILVQEAEDQDICRVVAAALSCGTADNADGKPDTLQELALTIGRNGGPAYDAASDRGGADARGIVSGFLFRTDRLSLVAADRMSLPVTYRGAPLPGNADVANPKTFNAVLPADVDRSTGVDGDNVFTRAPQVGLFEVRAAPGSPDSYQLWAISNHFSSGPETRVGQRREQAAYNAAIVAAVEASRPGARVVLGGDLNVFPRPDDPTPATPGDQLGPLYTAGLHNLWDNLVADAPSTAYSYVFEGQAQTLDQLFVNNALLGDLIQMRSAHLNADHPDAVSDHDPQVARFHSRAGLTVGDARVVEGDSGRTPLIFPVTLTRPLSRALTVCAATVPGTTTLPYADFDPYLGCRTIPAGSTRVEFPVQVRGDRLRERDEQLTLEVAALSAVRVVAGTGTGTIVNDD